MPGHVHVMLQVTGVEGLMASSALPENLTLEEVGEAGWRESLTVPGWHWKGGAGAEAVAGHMWAYPLIHDLVAEGVEQQQEVADLLESVVGEFLGMKPSF